MRWFAAVFVVAAVAAGCGGSGGALGPGAALGSARELVIVAHQDDDLLFVQPDVLDAVQAGTGVATLYVTAGDDGRGLGFAEQRERGVETAYAQALGLTLADWSCGDIDVIPDHVAEHCVLDHGQLSLVFLGYPDGGGSGQNAGSLLSLWQGDVAQATTIARTPATYTQDELISAVAAVVTATAPQTVRTLEIASTHGHEHSDHMLVGALAVLAVARGGLAPALVSYRGYDVDLEQATKSDAFAAPQIAAVEAYDACVGECSAPCGSACATISADHATWVHRRYAVGFRDAMTGARIADASGSGCVAIGEDSMSAIADCATAPAWTLRGGELVTAGSGSGAGAGSGDVCLTALPTGELVGDACGSGAPSPNSRWFVDDEGHLWGSLVPVPQADMAFAHLDCVAESGGRPRLVLCGAAVAPVWTFTRGAPVTSQLVLPFSSRLGLIDVTGDGLADLVFDDGTQLVVAPGDGSGGFGSAQPGTPLAVAADSLAVGAGASGGAVCGLAPTGASCAIGSAVVAWGPALVQGDDEVDNSLGVVGGELCSLTPAPAIACAAMGGSATTLTTAVARDATVWIGDLDGDGSADWCAAGGSGAACGVRADAAVSADGSLWSFSQGGGLEAPPFDRGASGLADVDGDGRADLCGLAASGVSCARGQGHGFGPALPLAPVATAADDPQLVLGDLDGDGHADACVAPGDGSIRCQLSP